MDLGPLLEVAGAGPSPALDRAIAAATRAHAAHAGEARSIEDIVPCACMEIFMTGWLADRSAPLPAANDAEGARVDAALPPVFDAHVHVFPDPVFARLWAWFEKNAWPVRYRLPAPEIVPFLLDRGVARVALLHYGHKPGMSRALNAFVADLARGDPRIVPLATVLPGEPEAAEVVADAARLGLRGLKLHCHVQAFAPDHPDADAVWSAAESLGLPVIVHAGREPKSPAYPVDTYAVCSAERVERVLRAHPRLAFCVPHLGADEFEKYKTLLERYDNLYLDTTCMLAEFFVSGVPRRLIEARPERILYGTDFPNLPYAWDRELKKLVALGLPEAVLARILSGTAEQLFAARG